MNSIIFRPTNDCNLKCSYCYDEKNHTNLSLNAKKLKATNNFIKNEFLAIKDVCRILEHSERPNLIFHGGEPLLVDSTVLNHFSSQLRKRLDLKFSIQTNATLIDQDAINFFKNHNVSVGVSLDGADDEQNSERVDFDGNSTFNIVIEKLEWLKAEHINFGIVMSINKKHIGQEQKIYDFLAQYNYNCNIRPVFNSLNSNGSNVMTSMEYIEFFNNLFDIWYDDQEQKVQTYQIMDLSNALSRVLLEKKDENINEVIYDYIKDYSYDLNDLPIYNDGLCSSSDACFRHFICLDIQGDAYACNRLYRNPNFYYGNVRNMDIDELNKKINQLVTIRKRSIDKSCGSCDNIRKCNGGCPAEAYNLYKDFTLKSSACFYNKEIDAHVKKKILI